MDLSQESSIPPENLVFISTRSGGRRTQRLSRVAIVSSLVIFGALAPWTKIPLLRIDAFIPIYESAIIISDAITAVMLFGVFRILRSRSLWILATAYLLTASAAFIHLLTFPGLFSAGGLLGAGPQTTASLFVLWHGIFPVAVVGFVLLKKNDAVQSRASLGWSLGAGAFIFAGILTLATAGNQWLPLLIVNNHLTPTMTVLTSSELVIGGVGAWMLWRQKSPPVLDRWLLVAALASLIEIALSSTLDGGRFDLGFYSGRIYGLIASSLVLWVLLLEHSSLYGQLQSSNRELQDANRLKSQFVANMSHEIRTPLNGIIGLSELAIRNASDPKQTDYVTKIRDAGTSLLGIINDILDFSKIEAGKLEFERTGFSLDKVLAGISDMFHSRAEAKSLGYSQTVDDDVPRYLVGDPLRLGQVLINLVGNAIKFTDRGSVSLTVRLRASESDQATVEFSVRDTGIGLQPSDQEKLFTSFSQADSSTTRKFGGTGLGLAISKQLVNLMGGEIEVTSELGAGSCFAFWAVFLVDSQKEAQRKVIPGILNELRVLVIVENPATKMRLKSLLGAYPFLCDFADSGKEALETIKTPQSSRYDLYLIEIWLSKMSGYDILRCLRSEPAQEKKPAAIMISSLGSRQDRDQSFLEGSDAFLAEPIASSSLSDAILRIFSPLLREAGPADRETAADQTVSQELRGKRILVVEDNEVNRQIVEEFVHSYGVETEVATNGKEAVEKILGGTAQTAYDLVLMDIQMPEMDGLTATRLIRQHSPLFQAAHRRPLGPRHGRGTPEIQTGGDERSFDQTDHSPKAL